MNALFDVIELAHQKISEQNNLSRLGRVIELNRTMAKRVAKCREGALEKVHLALLLSRFGIKVG